MQKLAPRISVIAWTAWMVVNFAFGLYHPRTSSSALSLISVLQILVNFGVGGGAITLSVSLSRRPQRALAFILGALSLFAFWRFYIGVIFFKMHPKLGGLTFSESVADYWHEISKNIFFLLGTVPLGIFVGASIVFWPVYGLLYGSQKDD